MVVNRLIISAVVSHLSQETKILGELRLNGLLNLLDLLLNLVVCTCCFDLELRAEVVALRNESLENSRSHLLRGQWGHVAQLLVELVHRIVQLGVD